MSEPARSRIGWVLPALLAGGLSALGYALFGRIDLGLMDEGYLWYGTLRTAEGAVPIRDFQAYDPGRYWWGAAVTLFAGKGILGVRIAGAIFQALGLFCGLLVARRVLRHPGWLVLAGLVLASWMFPRHKVYESALAMMAVYAAVRVHERPSARMLLAAGIFVGLAGVMGRNHALYGFLGLLVVILLGHAKEREGVLVRKLAWWGSGVVVGYLPVLVTMAVVPGFFTAFVDSILVILRQGANLPSPYPWPWRVEYGGGLVGLLTGVSEAACFLLPAVVYPVGAVLVLRLRGEAVRGHGVLVAAVAVGAFYSHHAAVRSAPDHIAQCIHPALLVLLALPALLGGRRAVVARAIVLPLLAIASCLAVLDSNRTLASFRLRNASAAPVEHVVAGERLRLAPDKAAYLAGVEATVREHVGPDQALFIAPTSPGLYPMLGKISPTRGFYFYWPDETVEVQEEMLAAFAERDVRWALIETTALDGRADLRFESSHPLVWEHLVERFQRVRAPRLPPTHILLRRRDR